MNHLKMINAYLRNVQSADEIPRTGFPFVTISREAGAGGHLLAHVLATDFLRENGALFEGWHVFDREICEIIAQDSGIQASLNALLTEHYGSELRDFFEGIFSGQSRQYTLQKKIFKVVRMLALLGKVIIVGRSAAFVTADLTTGVHVRLVAAQTIRIKWMMSKLKISKEEATDLVRNQDKARQKLTTTYFDKDISDPVNYHVVWNSGKLDPHEMSHSVITMLKHRAAKNSAQAR